MLCSVGGAGAQSRWQTRRRLRIIIHTVLMDPRKNSRTAEPAVCYAIATNARSLLLSSMRNLLLFCLLAAASAAAAQWEVPVRLQLDGTTDQERQVVGVGAPRTSDAAVSLEAARDLRTSFATVTGTAVLVGTLTPVLLAYEPGMVITIMPAEANSAGAQLALNGLAATAIIRQDGSSLESGDLSAGVPARLAFDGTAFRLLNSARLSCPVGYTAGSNEFCIADSASLSTSYWTANVRCGNAGARLCSVAEWMTACAKIPGFFDTVPEAEWMDHAGNNVTSVKVIGHGLEGIDVSSFGSGCTYGNWDSPTNAHPYRCCTSR